MYHYIICGLGYKQIRHCKPGVHNKRPVLRDVARWTPPKMCLFLAHNLFTPAFLYKHGYKRPPDSLTTGFAPGPHWGAQPPDPHYGPHFASRNIFGTIH